MRLNTGGKVVICTRTHRKYQIPSRTQDCLFFQTLKGKENRLKNKNLRLSVQERLGAVHNKLCFYRILIPFCLPRQKSNLPSLQGFLSASRRSQRLVGIYWYEPDPCAKFGAARQKKKKKKASCGLSSMWGKGCGAGRVVTGGGGAGKTGQHRTKGNHRG